MTDNNGSGGKDERNLTIEVNRNEERGYSMLTVKDEDAAKLMAEVIIPDDMLISETYKMGGSVAPVVVMQEILAIAFEAIMTSFGAITVEDFDEPMDRDEEPPKAQ
jgi:hypothetical protein